MKKSNISLSVLTVLLFICTLFTAAYGQVITNFLPTTTSAGTGSQITISGSGFGPGPASTTKYIEFANSDNGGLTGVKPALVEYVSWADDKIVVIVPSRAGTGAIKVYNGTSTAVSSSSLTVSYNILNVTTYQPKHIDDNTQGGYTWQLELGFNGQSNAKNSFLKSLSAWTCFTGINWKVGAPTPANQTGRDGINIVRFDTGTELPAGVLGVAYTYYSSCGSNKWQIIETDLVFDKERNWNFEDALPGASEMDFQSVVQHELGHAHNLGHVIDSDDLMHYAISSGARNTIGQNNRSGGAFQVEFSVQAAGGSCSGAMTAAIPATCGSTYPKITSFSPAKAGTGTTVRIVGENLSTASAVTFGGTPAASFSVVSATQIDAVLATGASGEIAITTAGGTAFLNGFVYLPPPVINSFLPNFGFLGDTITISGTNLNTTSLISFGDIPAASFIVVNDQTVKAVLGAGASGKISLITTAGTVEASGFTYAPRPSISSFTPSGKLGDIIVINGSNFKQIQSVKFGGMAAASFTVDSDQKISAVLGLGSAGIVTVTSTYGTATKEGFVYFPAPTITAFNPQLAAEGATVRITGTNFTGATEVLFGGKAQSSFVVNSATEISVIINNAANGSVSVTTSGGTAVKEGFTFISTLRIDSFSPKIAATDQKVVVNGSNFIKVIELSFGGTPAKSFTVDSETMITAIVALGSSGDIKIRTADGLVSAPGFTYIMVPRVDYFTPANAGAGTTLRITGINFDQVTSVKFGSIEAASFKVLSATTIEAVLATGASGAVSVTNPGGTGEIRGFTFIPLPAISSIDPLLGGKGTEINIYGTNFLTTHTVSIGNKVVTSFKIISATHISAYVADGASDGKVVVSTLGGSSSFDGFRFILPPLVSSFLPQSAIAGVSVLITGANLGEVKGVSFGGKAAASFTILSPTSISAVVASGSASGNIVLTNPGGQAIKEGFTFIYTLPSTNFSISATGLSCRGTMNGIISIKTLQTLNYTATITGNGQNNRYDFSNSLQVKNLSPGVYDVCFTISTESTFKQCFEITVTEPKDLALYSFINRADNKLNLKLEGADTYFVELNGERIKTSINEIQLSLKSGLNKVKVYTDKLCQGIIERSFFVDAVQIYPNPFTTELNLVLGSEYSGAIKVEILNMGGKLIYSKDYPSDGGILRLNLDELAQGPYLLQISSGEHRTLRKILRQ
ncbi:IPT/TIG domain-containing protein [Daejeonella sp.]|uniref:IPT/TIG domain-containing protein n=1 Tax=Daejeonella sp. TaxID=2805397 RepID=UPI0027BA4B83|nr:IPT/TIG domain-containing protein [Daejeonella sp.]